MQALEEDRLRKEKAYGPNGTHQNAKEQQMVAAAKGVGGELAILKDRRQEILKEKQSVMAKLSNSGKEDKDSTSLKSARAGDDQTNEMVQRLRKEQVDQKNACDFL